MISLMTVFTMFPAVSITASAATYCGPDEIGGKVLIESSDTSLKLFLPGSIGTLEAYKFKFNGETGYCIDPQSFAQTTSGQTVEFTNFYGETGKELIKLDPNTSDQKEKALISGLMVFYGGYGDYFSTFSNGGKTAKSIMDGYLANSFYASYFSSMSKTDAYYFLSHYALSQLYHEMINDNSTAWKAWSSYTDITTMINGVVNFAKSIASNDGDYNAIKNNSAMNNYYICHPKPQNPISGATYQHLIVRIPKKARLSLQKSGSNDTIKNLTETTQDKDYLNFTGAQYTLYNKSDNSVVAVAELNRNGNIEKIKYSYSNKDWISKSYFELEAGNYYLKETKVPNSGKYFTLDTTEYPVTVTADDCKNERTLDILKVNETEIVKMLLKKVSSESELTTDNDCYDLDGTTIAVFPDERSAYEYLADNTKKSKIIRYFITDSYGNAKAISLDGNNWDYNLNSDLYKIPYSDTLYAVETKAGKGFKKCEDPVKLELSATGTSGGYALITATIVNEPENDPVRILLQKKNAVTGTTENMAGAEFTVKFYKGYYDSADDLETLTPERKWILKTDSDGYCRLDEEHRAESDFGEAFYVTSEENPNPAMPLGTFTVQETKAPAGFKINPEIFIRQIKMNEATGSISTFNEIEVPETPDVGYIKIHKQAQTVTGFVEVGNATYGLYSDSSCRNILQRTVTDSNGIGVFSKGVEFGTYYIKEIINPVGFTLDPTVYSVQVTAENPTVDKAVMVEVLENVETGSLKIIKKSDDGVLDLYFLITSSEGYYNIVKTSAETGEYEISGLPIYNGNSELISYTVKELGELSPSGNYIIPKRYDTQNSVTEVTKTLAGSDSSKPIEFEHYNKLYPMHLRVVKKSDDSVIEGMYFNLKDNLGNDYGNLATDSTGKATFTGLSMYNSDGRKIIYTLTELGTKNADGTYSLPKRYKQLKPSKFVLSFDKATLVREQYYRQDVTVENKLEYGNLAVQKLSEDNIVKDFYFNIKSSDGKVNKTICTDSTGFSQLTNLDVYDSSDNLISYTVTELGFKKSDGTYYIPNRYNTPKPQTVTLKKSKTVTVNYQNTLKKSSINVVKTAIDGVVEGIYFNLTDSNGNNYGNKVTDSKGVTKAWTDLPIYNSDDTEIEYTVKELGFKQSDGSFLIPDYYVKANDVTVTLSDSLTTVKEVKINNLLVNGEVVLIKKDDKDNRLAGVKFALYRASDNSQIDTLYGYQGCKGDYSYSPFSSYQLPITEFVTDDYGELFICHLPYGNYYFKEVEGLNGYVFDKDKEYHFKISEEQTSVEIPAINEIKRGSVTLTKTDFEGNPQEGVGFELYDSNDNKLTVYKNSEGNLYMEKGYNNANTAVTTLFTDNLGKFTIERMESGNYYFIETVPVPGFSPYGKNIDFTIDTTKDELTEITLTAQNSKTIIPNTGGTGNNRSTYIDIGIAILALTILVGALGIRKKKKHIGKKAQQ